MSCQPGINQRAQNVPRLMLLSAKIGIVRATTRPPISWARRDGSSWWAVRSSWPAATPRTFQLSGRLARALIWAINSISRL